ncbi:MAG: hypothetical protein Q7J36_12275 [Thiobacillus sp.]|nr:hypothetical protein [Thiobacillus sp.]
MLSDGNQVVGLLFAGLGAFLLGLFLPRERKLLFALFAVGLAATLGSIGLSLLQGIPPQDLVLLRDRTQFGKIIPIGYALVLGSILAWLHLMITRR